MFWIGLLVGLVVGAGAMLWLVLYLGKGWIPPL
jgi:hypothetical protein